MIGYNDSIFLKASSAKKNLLWFICAIRGLFFVNYSISFEFVFLNLKDESQGAKRFGKCGHNGLKLLLCKRSLV